MSGTFKGSDSLIYWDSVAVWTSLSESKDQTQQTRLFCVLVIYIHVSLKEPVKWVLFCFGTNSRLLDVLIFKYESCVT